MTTELTDLGLTIDRFTDLVSKMELAAKDVWGESVDTSDTELLGHFIRQAALIGAEINETLQDVLDVLSSANVTGTRLEHLFSLLDLPRQSAAYSTVALTYTVAAATTIPAGHRVRTAAGVIFQTIADLVFVGAGSASTSAQCTEYGPFDAAIDEVCIPVTTVYGLTSVTNAAAAIPGRLRETDPQYKERHTAAVATSGEDDIAGIYSAVSDVSGVSDCRVVEGTGTITVSVIGGADADVAEAIDNNRTAGISTLGDQSVDVYSETTGETTTINFYRAIDREFFVALTLYKNKALFPDDGELQIKNALVAMADATYRINGIVDYRALQTPVYSVQGVTISDLRIGWAAAPTGITNLTTTIQQRAALPIENISISFVTT
jgi:uncharacterized phage protein gp47/JayE